MKRDELSTSAFVLLFALIALTPLFLFAFAAWCDKVDRDHIADVVKRYDAMTRQITVKNSPHEENEQKEDTVNDQMVKVTFSDWLKTPVGSTAKRNVTCFMSNLH